jgi:hypothetical protein
MSSAFEAMGMSLPYSSTMAAEDAEKADSAEKSAFVLVEAIRKQLLPRQILTRKAFENAIAVVMAVGGSTNSVLHFLAIAHSMGVELSLDDFETIRAKVPVLCDLKPSGQYVATDLHRAGGIPQVMKMLLVHGLLHGEALTITGQTIAEVLADVPEEPPTDQDVIRPWNNPLYAQGHLAILPRCDSGGSDSCRGCAGHPLRGSEGGTRNAGNVGTNFGNYWCGFGGCGWFDYRWTVFWWDIWDGCRSCCPRGSSWRCDRFSSRR